MQSLRISFNAYIYPLSSLIELQNCSEICRINSVKLIATTQHSANFGCRTHSVLLLQVDIRFVGKALAFIWADWLIVCCRLLSIFTRVGR